WIALIAAVVLFAFSIGFRFTMQLTSSFMNDVFDIEDDFIEETMIEDGDMSNRIAKLSLCGQIMETEQAPFASVEGFNEERFLERIDSADQDHTLIVIEFEVDSPGGDVGITSHLQRRITEMQEEYENGVYITTESSAASPGYYV